MKQALRLAARGKGYVAPNPMVGCVIYAENGHLIGSGYHERYGQPHAEVNALNSVKDKTQLDGATVYVTLEPCSHHGKTPPCCEALGAWPIRRVVVAMTDPNPKVHGKGIRYLQDRGIRVDTGLLSEEAGKQNEFFLHYINSKRPFVTLKVAQTLDGYISAADGESRWISSERARRQVHRWRSEYDAVMVGRNTALLDNPRLTVRHVPGRQPARIVIDGPGNLPQELHLFSDIHEAKTIRVTYHPNRTGADSDPALNLLKGHSFRGKTLSVSEIDGHCNLEQMFEELGAQKISSVLVEAGNNLASALVRAGLVDKLHLFLAPKMLGAGTRSFLGLGVDRMSEIITFRTYSWKKMGEDMLFTGYF